MVRFLSYSYLKCIYFHSWQSYREKLTCNNVEDNCVEKPDILAGQLDVTKIQNSLCKI